MNIADIVVIAILAVVITWAVRRVIKNRKCGNCCSSCDGNCSACAKHK